MTTRDDDRPASAFDERLRQRHAQALAQVGARTRLRLQPRRPDAVPAPPRRPAWAFAATAAAVLVVGGWLWRSALAPRPDPAPVLADADDAAEVYAALDESPEFYLWLAANDAPLDGAAPGNADFDVEYAP